MIEFKNITKVYKAKKADDTIALKNINIKFDNKGLVFIIGTSGSGKSTFLNLIGGLDSPTSGEIIVDKYNISKFKNKEYDSYRNTYVGFVFQEFNLLENLNVYENIELSLKLQNKSTNNNEVVNILKEVGIDDLKDRKINELSGGQKQRVAISRALIKEPNIILADEPTGNLDSKSSTQIFNILKEISKSKLVIVVSHDEEAASKYADRIIKLEDGIIVKDTNKCDKTNENKLVFNKAKLPLLYALKIALSNIKKKPFKLITTIILATFSLVFMGFTAGLTLFDKELFLVNTMFDNNNYNYQVRNIETYSSGGNMVFTLKEEDINNIKKITNKKVNINYSLFSKGKSLNFEFGENSNPNSYYSLSLNNKQFSSLNFIEIEDENIIPDIIGRIPNVQNEIAVHKYFADYMIKFGIKTVDNNLYYPKNYEEIVNSKKEIKLNDNSVIIVGIVNDDDSLFKEYKESNKRFPEESRESNYYTEYSNNGKIIYVKGFVKNAKLSIDKNAIVNNMHLELTENKKLTIIDKDIKVLTSDGEKVINSIYEDEIILAIDNLFAIDGNYEKEFNSYLKANDTISYKDNLYKFTLDYLKRRKLNRKIELYIHSEDVSLEVKNSRLKIVGITLDDTNYLSKSYIDNYNPNNRQIYSVTIYDNNKNNLLKTFKKMHSTYREYDNGQTISGYHYDINAGDDNELASVIFTSKSSLPFVGVASLVFTGFALLLFSNFIAVSVSYAKEEIGILKALGTNNNDIIKIFSMESFIVSIISWILAVILWLGLCEILNNHLYGKLYFEMNGIIPNPLVPAILLIFLLAISFLISMTSIGRITKIKPIDAILNK